MYFEIPVGLIDILPRTALRSARNEHAMMSQPALGPLLAVAYDKAVGIMASRWKVFAGLVIVSSIAGYRSFNAGVIPSELFLIYWTFAVYANAARLAGPAYRMHFGKALTLLGTYLGVGLLTEICFFALIVPGIWVGNRYSMSTTVAVIEDKNMNDATKRSWEMTADAFWPTLGFNAAVWFGMLAVIVGSYFALTMFASVVDSLIGPVASTGGLRGCALDAGLALFAIALMYANQAQVLAQLYWYRWLLTKSPLPA
jgi:hypothetical protein